MKIQTKSGDYSNFINMYVFDQVQPNTDCLDVGCWVGDMGSKLISVKNCRVDGVDFVDSVLKSSKSKGYGNTFKVNLNNDSINLMPINKKYDFILFADVLEHLINPFEVLKLFSQKLKPGGRIIISIPNVAFIQNRINLLFGNWNYTEFGTLDKTHLKFFTSKSMKTMLIKSGFKIEKYIPYNQFKNLKRFDFIARLFPNLLYYQFLFVVSRA